MKWRSAFGRAAFTKELLGTKQEKKSVDKVANACIMQNNLMKLTPTQIKAIAQEVQDQVYTIRKQRLKSIEETVAACKDMKLLLKQQQKVEQEVKRMNEMARGVASKFKDEQTECQVYVRVDSDSKGYINVQVTDKHRNNYCYDVGGRVQHELTLQSINNNDVDVAELIAKLVKQYAH